MAQYARRRLTKSLMGATDGGGDAEEGALPLASWHVIRRRHGIVIFHRNVVFRETYCLVVDMFTLHGVRVAEQDWQHSRARRRECRAHRQKAAQERPGDAGGAVSAARPVAATARRASRLAWPGCGHCRRDPTGSLQPDFPWSDAVLDVQTLSTLYCLQGCCIWCTAS
jgi:hypothetical protein